MKIKDVKRMELTHLKAQKLRSMKKKKDIAMKGEHLRHKKKVTLKSIKFSNEGK